MPMRLALYDVDPAVVAAWAPRFGPYRGVTFGVGDLLEVRSVDAVVSPANGFGFMDGGIDRAYRAFFGAGVERRVRELIALRAEGELPVGQAMVVPTGHPRITRLVVAPTMRMPGQVRGSNHAYLATWAALKRATQAKDPPIACLGLPGMATGVGDMDPDEAADQMLRAFVEVLTPERR